MSPLSWHKKRYAVGMSSVAEVILDLIFDEGQIAVTDVMRECHHVGVASTATIHTELVWLREHHYVKVSTNAQDARRKDCALTAKGVKHLNVS